MNAKAQRPNVPFDPDRAALKKAKRVVVKVGTSLLTGGTTRVHTAYLRRLVGAIGELWNQGREVALVTSGAIGAGCGRLGFEKPPLSLPERQACASVGQVELMSLYENACQALKPPRVAGQLLLTRDGLENRKRYLNARNTLEALFARGAVPVINENDTVSVDEIRVGDNDTLSALVAVAAEAQVLVVLTDVDGFMDADPSAHPEAKVIHTVTRITPALEALARPASGKLGTGGMVTKLKAAQIVTAAGEHMVLAPGRDPEILADVLAGKQVGTFFPPTGDRLAARKRWLAFTPRTQGTIHVDAGAVDALAQRHKSLLPSGIVRVEGTFESGDLVALAGPDGRAFAQGLSNYTHEEVRKIAGCKTAQIPKLIGAPHFKEVVHRDNLVVL
ncbi:MAG: glutamate 5-kinase [Planctomycetes bacterium]|nr:glutamate 5-kinase [Planctomycetota bacterium]